MHAIIIVCCTSPHEHSPTKQQTSSNHSQKNDQTSPKSDKMHFQFNINFISPVWFSHLSLILSINLSTLLYTSLVHLPLRCDDNRLPIHIYAHALRLSPDITDSASMKKVRLKNYNFDLSCFALKKLFFFEDKYSWSRHHH